MSLGCLTLAFVGIVILVRQEPAFFGRVALPAAGGGDGAATAEEAEILSRRMVTKAAAWAAALDDGGPWEAAVTEAEVNGWLACDLPRNHARLLPRGLSEPRVAFAPRHLLGGARLAIGPLTAVAWFDLEVVLRDVNHLAIAIDRAGLGAIPLPRTAMLRELGRRIGGLGMLADLRSVEGRPVLMVYIPSTHDAGATSYRLESFALDAGELLLAGETRSAGEPPRRPGVP